MGAPVWGSGRVWEGGPRGWISPGTLRDNCNGAPETGHLSPRELC